MKWLIFSFGVATVLYAIFITEGICIQCTFNGQCNGSTQCSGGNKPICEHDDPTDVNENGGLCTCSVGSCFSKEDCYGSALNLSCADSLRHCYDNTCICSRFPIPGK